MTIRFKLLAIIACLLARSVAAQTPSTFTPGSPIASAAMNAALAAKQDVNGPALSTSGQSVQIAGQNGLSISIGFVHQQGVFAGPYAGASLPANITYGSAGFGANVLEHLANGNAEDACGGWSACQYAQSGGGITAWGEHAIGFDDPANASAFGNDAMRDTIGNDNSTAVGQDSQADGVGSRNTSIGTRSMWGNAGSITITGTKTTGDVLHVALTTTNSNVSGLPATASYTVLSGDTLATMAAGLAAAISNLPVQDSNFVENRTPLGAETTDFGGGPATIRMHFPGGTAAGWAITPVTSCTGTCTETLTVGAPYSGTDNVAVGIDALNGAALTSGSTNFAGGDYSLANLGGTSSGIICIGHFCGFAATGGGTSVIMGAGTAQNASVLLNDVIIAPGGAGGLTTGTDETIIGGLNGNANCITTGTGNVEIGYGGCVLSPTTNWQLDIQKGAIIGANNNAGGGGAGGGQIGIEMTTAPNATFEVGDYGGVAADGSHIGVQQSVAVGLSGCTGCSLDATASDTAGTVTEGTSQTGFVLAFHAAYATAPHCVVSSPTGGGVTSYAVLVGSLTVVNPSLTGAKYSYICLQ